MKIFIDEETMQGNPLLLLQKLQIELANQILTMNGNTAEDLCYNMREMADVFEMLEEHINDETITLKHNPMGSWYILEEPEEENVRICSECKKIMHDGYVIDNGLEYYCSDECLHKNITEEEYQELYDDGNGDSYWTMWED